MRFFVLLITCLLDENRMPRVERRMRNTTNSVNCQNKHFSLCFSVFQSSSIRFRDKEIFIDYGLQMLPNWVQLQ